MFIAKYLYNKLNYSAPTKDWYIQEYKAIIDEINALPADNEEAHNDDVHVDESFLPNAEFFRYRGRYPLILHRLTCTTYNIPDFSFAGIVTHLYENGGRVDEKYRFNAAAAANKKLKIGHRVTCMARKISDDQPVVIYTIDSIDQDSWMPEDEDLSNVTPSALVPLNTYQKLLRGEIKAKFNGEIVIETRPQTAKNIKLVISEIGCGFNPTVGDQVEVEVEYGIDPKDSANDALVGYYSMKAIETKFITGKISSFKKRMQYGLIDEKYLFFMDVLQHSSNQNFVPNKGDTVNCEVISSFLKIDDQEFYYRCIKLTQIKSNESERVEKSAEQKNVPIVLIESDDEFEDESLEMTFTKNDALKVTLDSSSSKKQIQLIATNNTDCQRRISVARFNNEIIASQIDCNALHQPQVVKPRGTFVYNIEVTGLMRVSKLKINFKIDSKFLVRRCIQVEVKTINDCSGPRVEHSKAYTKKIYSDKVDTIRGKAPVSAPHFIDQRLNPFTVPKRLFDDAMAANNSHDLLDAEYGDLFIRLAPDNYENYFHHLLYFEEVLMRHEFRMYDVDRGHFIRDGEYLVYHMARNIFECRPSIVIGDMIYAESLLQPSIAGVAPIQYQGFIHRIKRHRLLLKFSDEFQNSYRGEDYKLIFRFSRSKYIKQHNAIDRVGKKLRNINSDFFFPTSIKPGKDLQLDVKMVDGNIELQFPKQKLAWFNSKLNEIQKLAVMNVLRGEAKMYPYLVFGPPVSVIMI